MKPDPAPAGGVVPDRPAIQTSVTLVGDGTDIAHGRHLAVGFLTQVQAEHGLSVSQRAMDLTQLVVSELVTNARKYAPGPILLDLRIADGLIEVGVWDSDPVLPIARAANAGRVGQHGLEIVMAVARDFEAQREDAGKRITARIALTDDPGGITAERRTS
ncbi:ATP-binding protein [Streptomyces sp. NBC_00083]|uniref:ATP-binding protein n=1 Tax=Streptomyces sp. NBC_00083 TaxID=2975647 RepID=UPI00224E8A33|nr:ATP-binding protein [Streptomyces sp. NBC_00083]MCX5387368.1 ATP-binding protein [Streptomyces sp. NBC_00083]